MATATVVQQPTATNPKHALAGASMERDVLLEQRLRCLLKERNLFADKPARVKAPRACALRKLTGYVRRSAQARALRAIAARLDQPRACRRPS